MPKLSENQAASLLALEKVTRKVGVAYVSRAVWKKACPEGVSVNTAAMLKTGAVVAIPAGVSVNGKIIELYAPA